MSGLPEVFQPASRSFFNKLCVMFLRWFHPLGMFETKAGLTSTPAVAMSLLLVYASESGSGHPEDISQSKHQRLEVTESLCRIHSDTIARNRDRCLPAQHNRAPASSSILSTRPILEYCAFLVSLPFFLPIRTSCDCEHPHVPMPLAAQISVKVTAL